MASVGSQQPPQGRSRLATYATTSGMLLAAAGAPFSIVAGTTSSLLTASPWVQGGATLSALLLLGAAWQITRRPLLGRVLSTAGLLAAFALAVPYLATSPAGALAALVAITAALALLWQARVAMPELSHIWRRPVDEGQAQGAAVAASVLWFARMLAGTHRSLVDTLVVGWALGCFALLGVDWAGRNFASRRLRATTLLLAIAGAAALSLLVRGSLWWTAGVLAIPAIITAGLVRRRSRLAMERSGWWEALLVLPERLFVGTFAGLCLIGGVVLALPQSAASGQSIGLVNALFTATSAVCVTGLIVVDTPVHLSAFGQLVVMLLIQVGGLGIMTFSTVLLWALGRRMSLQHEGVAASLMGSRDRSRLFATAKRILQLTLYVEAVGAALLALAFLATGDDLAQALWRGLFTAISAFCNAGFALQSDNLIPYQRVPLVLHTVSLLIVLGGLSPLAVFALPALARRSASPPSAQARLIFGSTALLLLSGFFFVLAFEWHGALAGLSALDKLHNAWLQSVTLRTAGFNSIDLTVARAPTLTVMMLWMFIGGSPGSTAGGVKTTTISVLLLSVLRAIRGQWTLEVFGKRVPERTRAKATVVVSLAVVTGIVALLAMQLTQRLPTRVAAFEVVSALGTVGLSIGGTAQLDDIGKIVIIVCMFIGRVGGLTLLMFLGTRQSQPMLGRPEEEIDVG